ncbi:eukaryotic translation initiation factor 3 subunit D, partial [Ochromonadaceae sp. CCMP2298]
SSLAVGGDWEVVEEFDLAQLLKLQANIPKAEELLQAGHLDLYDESYDKTTTRTAKPLKKVENKFFVDVTSGEDPVLQRLHVEQVGDVYATDAILAQLMAAPRSVASWDVVIEKVQGAVFLDKRDNTFDLLSVAETSHDPPTATDEFDEPEPLAVEATMINQNFSQQVLLEGQRKTFEPNPFCDDLEPGMEAASVAYRYRLFHLGDIKLVARWV